MQESNLASLREQLKLEIKNAIKEPIASLIEKIGSLPHSCKLNIESRKHAVDKLLIDLGERKSPNSIKNGLSIIELAGNHHGRDLITSLITDEARQTDELLMIEVGAFLGGSALRWAKASPKCRIIAIDPWANDHTEYLKSVYTDPNRRSMLSDINEDDFKTTLAYLQSNGSLSYTKQITHSQPNIGLVRSQSPAFLLSLYFRQVYPDIIYFDADKEGQDIELAISLFPSSIICGDDYLWTDQSKINPIMSCLEKLTKSNGRVIFKKGQSWILGTQIDSVTENDVKLNSATAAADEISGVVNRYMDHCSICGEYGVFEQLDWRERESYKCKHCGGSLREREQAKTILVNVLNSHHRNLKDLVESDELNQMTVYEPGEIGSMRRYTLRLKNYIQSALHDCSDNSIRTEDLQSLSIQSNTVDLMISSDIVEHIDEPFRAFKEILRVLKPGGCHCFTVPLHREFTRFRMKLINGKKMYLESKHYHGDGKGGQSLVVTDFGCDIVNLLNDIGYRTEIVWCQAPGIDKHVCGTVVAKKPLVDSQATLEIN